MADLKQVRYQHPDLSYTDDLRTYADASLNLTTALPAGTKHRLVDALGRAISEIDEVTGDIARTRYSDAAAGPGIALRHESANPAVDDAPGRIRFQGYNDAAALIDFAEVEAIVKNVSAGAEEAWFRFRLMNGGTLDADAFEVRIVGGVPKLYVGGVEVSGSGGGGTAEAALVYKSSATTIPNNTWTTVPFDSVVRDDGEFYDGGNPTRFTIQNAGWYVLSHTLFWDHDPAGARAVRFMLNGSTEVPARVWSQDFSARGMTGSAPAYYSSAGDYVEMQILQSSGGNLNLSGTSGEQTHFGIYRV